MTERLYTTKDIATALGTRPQWVNNQLRHADAPQPDFVAAIGGGPSPSQLWRERSLQRWMAYHASRDSVRNLAAYPAYSDHKAVNQVGTLTATYKLWWRPMPNGSTMWWFSTPQGWWTSTNDGHTWEPTNDMVRPVDYHYTCVNGSAVPTGAVAAVLARTAVLRERVEESEAS